MKGFVTVLALVAALVLGAEGVPYWYFEFPDAKVRINCDEARAHPYSLEDPLEFADGHKVENEIQWRERRRKILGIFEREMYGRRPPRPETVEIYAFLTAAEKSRALGGAAVRIDAVIDEAALQAKALRETKVTP